MTKPFAEYTVKVFVKSGVPADTDEEINALSEELDEFLCELEFLAEQNAPVGFRIEVKD